MSHQYYCKINHQLYGPISGQNLQELALLGRLSPDDEVRLDGTNRWIRAGDIKNLQFQNKPQKEAEPAESDKTSQLNVSENKMLDLMAKLAESEETSQPVHPPVNHSPKSNISIPPPQEYKAVETVAAIYIALGYLTILVGVVLLVLLGGSRTEDKGPVFVSVVVSIAIAVLSIFATAQLLMMAVNSAKNLDRLTSSNLIIMKAILQDKKQP